MGVVDRLSGDGSTIMDSIKMSPNENIMMEELRTKFVFVDILCSNQSRRIKGVAASLLRCVHTLAPDVMLRVAGRKPNPKLIATYEHFGFKKISDRIMLNGRSNTSQFLLQRVPSTGRVQKMTRQRPCPTECVRSSRKVARTMLHEPPPTPEKYDGGGQTHTTHAQRVRWTGSDTHHTHTVRAMDGVRHTPHTLSVCDGGGQTHHTRTQ
jgi:hypothetical protein